MVARISRPFSTALRGVLAAVGARWRLFDCFTFNPWLRRLPDYLAARPAPR